MVANESKAKRLQCHAWDCARLAPDALYAALQKALMQEAFLRLTTAPTEPTA